VEQSGGTASEVDPPGAFGFSAHGSHEVVQAGYVNRRAHEGGSGRKAGGAKNFKSQNSTLKEPQ